MPDRPIGIEVSAGRSLRSGGDRQGVVDAYLLGDVALSFVLRIFSVAGDHCPS